MLNVVLEYVRNMLHENEKEKIYDLYDVLGINTKEVIMCRFIRDILDPHGHHKKGDKYLRKFLEIVLQIPSSELDSYLDGVTVEKEYTFFDKYLGKERRIDLVIWNNKHFIPIEVKIYAEEQEAQCYVYYDYAKGFDKEARIYYLTPQGSLPSDYSRTINTAAVCSSVKDDDLVCISFARDILSWLKCIINSETDDMMKYNITQYMYAVKSFTGRFDMVEKKTIINELLENKDKLIAGIEISNVINDAKIQVMRNMFIMLEKSMGNIVAEYNIKKLDRNSFVSWENLVDGYYKSNNVYPGINYKLNDIELSDGVEIWFRVELYNNLYAGFCVTRNGMQINVKDLSDTDIDKISTVLSVIPMRDESWWITYEYLPGGGNNASEETPDYRKFNDAAIALSESETLKNFCGKSVETIKREFFERIKR